MNSENEGKQHVSVWLSLNHNNNYVWMTSNLVKDLEYVQF